MVTNIYLYTICSNIHISISVVILAIDLIYGITLHTLKCVQWVVLLGWTLGRMFGGSPHFLFVFYRPDISENVRS